METVRAKQAKLNFAYFVQRNQSLSNCNTLNLTQSSILMWPFRCTSRRSFLNSLVAAVVARKVDTTNKKPSTRPRVLKLLNLDKNLSKNTISCFQRNCDAV